MSDLIVRELELGDEVAFRAAVAEFARVNPDWEFAFSFNDSTDFAEYVVRLRRARRGEGLPDGWVRNSFLIASVGDAIVGRVSLRHELNDFLREIGGHIGFGVVPSWRRRGCGTEMLRQTLPMAAALGIDRVLVTCDDDNAGSATIIERCGGRLEDKCPRDDGGITRRYWIELAA